MSSQILYWPMEVALIATLIQVPTTLRRGYHLREHVEGRCRRFSGG
jgi:hypothetical protein